MVSEYLEQWIGIVLIFIVPIVLGVFIVAVAARIRQGKPRALVFDRIFEAPVKAALIYAAGKALLIAVLCILSLYTAARLIPYIVAMFLLYPVFAVLGSAGFSEALAYAAIFCVIFVVEYFWAFLVLLPCHLMTRRTLEEEAARWR